MIRRLVYFAVFSIAAIAAVVFARSAFVDRPQAGAPVELVIPSGANADQVAMLLAQKTLIRSSALYRLYARMDAAAGRPKAGTYEMRKGSSLRTIARVLAQGPMRNEREARIIEGWTVDDEIAYLQADLRQKPEDVARVTGRSADRAAFDVSLREDFAFLRSLPESRSLEGYLFPDTYRIWEDQLPEGLARKQLVEFEKRFGASAIGAKSAPLRTLDDAVILASVIEKEVRAPVDRKIVAGIFLRRLKEGMALQSDATITYVTGSSRARANASDLALDSPYNTYRHRGLPPGPICNPGASAIEAVLDPAPSPYRFFLTDPKGKVYYAVSFEEHVRNKQKAGYERNH